MLDTKSGEDERVRFNHEDVSRELWSSVMGESSEDSNRLIMVLVVTVKESQVGR